MAHKYRILRHKLLEKRLAEKEETDVKFRQEALRAYQNLDSFLENTENWKKLEVLSQGKYMGSFALDGNHLGSEYSELTFIFSPQRIEPRAHAKFGFVKMKSGDIQPIIAFFHLEDDFDIDSVPEVSQTSFVHEYIHYLDYLRFQGSQGAAKHYKSKTFSRKYQHDYYNTPQEFNAYYQQGVEQFKRILKMFKNVPSRLEKQIPDTYEKFYDLMKKKFFDQNFIQSIDFKYQKKLHKRLRDFYDSIRKEYLQ